MSAERATAEGLIDHIREIEAERDTLKKQVDLLARRVSFQVSTEQRLRTRILYLESDRRDLIGTVQALSRQLDQRSGRAIEIPTLTTPSNFAAPEN